MSPPEGIGTVYTAGPMSGVPDHNFPAFREAAADLRERGMRVISPHELNDPEEIANTDPNRVSEEGWQEFLRRDLKIVCDVDAVVVLPGWENSRGANLEIHVARSLGKPILRYPDLWPIGEQPPKVRTFGTGATRDQDGSKLDYEGFLSPLALRRFGEYMHENRHQADGSVRDSDNWQKGIPPDVYMKSAWRHFMDWWALHRDLDAEVDLERTLCAVIFNAQGYLHEHLKGGE